MAVATIVVTINGREAEIPGWPEHRGFTGASRRTHHDGGGGIQRPGAASHRVPRRDRERGGQAGDRPFRRRRRLTLHALSARFHCFSPVAFSPIATHRCVVRHPVTTYFSASFAPDIVRRFCFSDRLSCSYLLLVGRMNPLYCGKVIASRKGGYPLGGCVLQILPLSHLYASSCQSMKERSMTAFGYTMMCEQSRPDQLIRDIQQAGGGRVRFLGDQRSLLPVVGGARTRGVRVVDPRRGGVCHQPYRADDLRHLPDHPAITRRSSRRRRPRSRFSPMVVSVSGLGAGREPERARRRQGLAGGRHAARDVHRGGRYHRRVAGRRARQLSRPIFSGRFGEALRSARSGASRWGSPCRVRSRATWPGGRPT